MSKSMCHHKNMHVYVLKFNAAKRALYVIERIKKAITITMPVALYNHKNIFC